MTSEIFPSISFDILTPDGNATIFIVYHSDRTIEDIDFFIGKAGTRLHSWTNALARMTVAALRSSSIDEVIDLLNDIATDRITIRSGITCRSGPEALAIALSRFRDMKFTRSSGPENTSKK